MRPVQTDATALLFFLMRYQGRLTQWNRSKGFGFITPNGGGGRVFVHAMGFRNGARQVTEGALLTFELGVDAQGRPRAEDIDFAGSPRKDDTPQRGDSPAGPLVVATFGFTLLGAALTGIAPRALLWLYVLASLVAVGLYWLDKRAATEGRWRTPESTLHLCALMGGWPGAVIAQRMLRHKTRKPAFRAAFWATVVINISAVGWLLAAPAAAPLRAGLAGI